MIKYQLPWKRCFNNSRRLKCEDVLLKELSYIVSEHQDENGYSVAWCWWAVTLFSVGDKRGILYMSRLQSKKGLFSFSWLH